MNFFSSENAVLYRPVMLLATKTGRVGTGTVRYLYRCIDILMSRISEFWIHSPDVQVDALAAVLCLAPHPGVQLRKVHLLLDAALLLASCPEFHIGRYGRYGT